MIFLGLSIGGLLGGWVGAAFDHGNWFGGWSILVSTAGSLLGIWAGYRAGRQFGL